MGDSQSNHGAESGQTSEADLRRIRQANQRLRSKVERLERTLELACSNPQIAWLYRNRSERMDPTVPIFEEARARFHLARYEFAARYASGRMVADIACGTGYGSAILKEQGKASSVAGIDLCAETIEYARAKHGGESIRFVVADAIDTGLQTSSVDLVVSFETIEHVPDAEALIDEFHRVLKPGGLLICSTPNDWPLEIAPHHVREFDRDSFVHTLERRFNVLELYNQNSGSDFEWNRGQAEGIVPTTEANAGLAECYIAIATRGND